MADQLSPGEMSRNLLGVLGGTFDPVHIGHLRTVMDLQQSLAIPEVRLIPNYQPPHRPAPVLEPRKRLQLLQSAISDLPGLVADDCEIIRQGESYMVDTLSDLKQRFADRHLCLIIGMDAYNSFCSWHQWSKILQLAHLVVMQRAGVDQLENHELDERITKQATQLTRKSHGLVYMQSVSQLDISSTRIRGMLSRGEDIRYLVPEVIRRDIETLYKG